MEGTNCKLSLLGHVADRTNGSMFIVNPLNLVDKFKSIIQNRVVATHVKVKLIVNHKYIYIRDEEVELDLFEKQNINKDKKFDERLRKSVIEKDIGNANIDTEITFEYGIKSIPNCIEILDELPFQIQITYEIGDKKAVRVYSKMQKFTTNREQAEKNLTSCELLFSNASQKILKQVLNSNINFAKQNLKAHNKLISQNDINLPKCYKDTILLVKNMEKTFKSFELKDSEAQMVFSNVKASRTAYKLDA